MLARPSTVAEIRQTFNKVLKGIVAGKLGGCPTDTGLDQPTYDILNLLARQPHPKRATDIVACRTEFARMLDGTHAREDAQEWQELMWNAETKRRNAHVRSGTRNPRPEARH